MEFTLPRSQRLRPNGGRRRHPPSGAGAGPVETSPT